MPVVGLPGWPRRRRVRTARVEVLRQTTLAWPWFVGMLPLGGVVFAFDGVLIEAGDGCHVRGVPAGDLAGLSVGPGSRWDLGRPHPVHRGTSRGDARPHRRWSLGCPWSRRCMTCPQCALSPVGNEAEVGLQSVPSDDHGAVVGHRTRGSSRRTLDSISLAAYSNSS